MRRGSTLLRIGALLAVHAFVVGIALLLSPVGCTTSSKSSTATATPTPRCTGNNWVSRSSMPTARGFLAAASVTIGGVAGVLAVGGSNGSNDLATAEFFNPSTGSWTTVSSLATARASLAAAPATIGGVAGVLAVGGGSGNTPFATAEFYNPSTGSWTAVASMSTARMELAAAPATIGGSAGVLAIGGSRGGGYFLATAEFYNPSTGGWTVVAPMPTARYAMAAASVTIGGVTGVLSVGGLDGNNNFATLVFYNPSTNSWTTVASMQTTRDFPAASPLTVGGVAGVLAFGGGYGGVGSALAAEFFNPSTGSWMTVSSMPTARDGSAAAPVTMSGIAGVLAIGGVLTTTSGTSYLSTAEFYCP